MKNLKHYILAVLLATLSAFILTSCSGGGDGGGGAPAPTVTIVPKDDDDDNGDPKPKTYDAYLDFAVADVEETTTIFFGNVQNLLTVTKGDCGVPGINPGDVGDPHHSASEVFKDEEIIKIKIEIDKNDGNGFKGTETTNADHRKIEKLSAIFLTTIPDASTDWNTTYVANNYAYTPPTFAARLDKPSDLGTTAGQKMRLSFVGTEITHDGKICQLGKTTPTLTLTVK